MQALPKDLRMAISWPMNSSRKQRALGASAVFCYNGAIKLMQLKAVFNMAFGIKREELESWKRAVEKGDIAFLTHYWFDPRFPSNKTITKVGCSNLQILSDWCVASGLNPRYIHNRQPFPHFDVIGAKQYEVLTREGKWEILTRFGMSGDDWGE